MKSIIRDSGSPKTKPDIILPFSKFVDVYISPSPMLFIKEIILVDIGGATLELYSYELHLFTDIFGENDTGRPLITVHPDHVTSGLDAYTDFMKDMMLAAAGKYRPNVGRIVAGGRRKVQTDGND